GWSSLLSSRNNVLASSAPRSSWSSSRQYPSENKQGGTPSLEGSSRRRMSSNAAAASDQRPASYNAIARFPRATASSGSLSRRSAYFAVAARQRSSSSAFSASSPIVPPMRSVFDPAFATLTVTRRL